MLPKGLRDFINISGEITSTRERLSPLRNDETDEVNDDSK